MGPFTSPQVQNCSSSSVQFSPAVADYVNEPYKWHRPGQAGAPLALAVGSCHHMHGSWTPVSKMIPCSRAVNTGSAYRAKDVRCSGYIPYLAGIVIRFSHYWKSARTRSIIQTNAMQCRQLHIVGNTDANYENNAVFRSIYCVNIVTDRVSREALKQSVASVRPSVCFHSVFWTQWSLNLSSCMCIGHDLGLSHLGLKVKVIG